MSRASTAAKTIGALVLLQAAAPITCVVTGTAAAMSRLSGEADERRDRPRAGCRTVLLSGGKMTKALTLARSFHRAGHRVVLVESTKYRWSAHRRSRCVDSFHLVPAPDDPDYAQALVDIVIAEDVDVYVPVCSPMSSIADAAAKPLLDKHCLVLHGDLDMIGRLDDKYEFARVAASLGLTVPDTELVRTPDDVAQFDFAGGRPPYVLKSIAYDPVNRLDLTPLPLATREQTLQFAAARPITDERPWILQSLLRGREYCTHGTVRDGVLTVYACCPSSAFQVNYEMVDRPAIQAWVRGLVEPLELTGQFSFDFIETEDGAVFPIECNPRTHSAVTMFYDHPDLARAYLDDVERLPAGAPITPTAASRPTYWLAHELWRMIRRPTAILDRATVIARGKDAVFDRNDPWPFLLLHHLQIPVLLVRSLLAGSDWVRIDFNIGKLVEPAGD